MKPRNPFIPEPADLPPSLPVFPLPGAVVMPGAELPLNIFEPRYLNLVQDALGGERLIGMIQPRDRAETPGLYDVGCAGRITHYQETNDGRLMITLTGVSRFRIFEELPSLRGYRIVRPDWSEFSGDYKDASLPDALRQRLVASLRLYLARENLDVDWEGLDELSTELLSSSLLAALPLPDTGKQLVLESISAEAQAEALAALLSEPATGGGNRVN